jgi:hypothetical protein
MITLAGQCSKPWLNEHWFKKYKARQFRRRLYCRPAEQALCSALE